jgi:hypothetical protein
MARDSDTATGDGDTAEPTGSDGGFDRQLLSDLSVNVVPILIMAVLVLAFIVLLPGSEGGDPLLLFHGALVLGVVLVSAVAGWVISREDAPLEGAAARTRDDSERD